jgi:hypothetical protein
MTKSSGPLFSCDDGSPLSSNLKGRIAQRTTFQHVNTASKGIPWNTVFRQGTVGEWFLVGRFVCSKATKNTIVAGSDKNAVLPFTRDSKKDTLKFTSIPAQPRLQAQIALNGYAVQVVDANTDDIIHAQKTCQYQ